MRYTHNYTGVPGLILQDQMITESMGPVVDRTFEHLAPSDIAISQMRRAVIRAARAHAKDGTLPPSARDPSLFLRARGGAFVADAGRDWLEVYDELLAASRLDGPTAQAAE